jgi:NAD(P)-dependent dehydrogenase (short-subunit alcohol dehydrogenase family)
MSGRVENRAVITGGTRGIGGAIARRLLADGYECLITGTRPRESADVPDGMSYVCADFRERAIVDDFARRLGDYRPAVLVNNVGLNIKGPTATFSDSDYDVLIDANLRAPFQLIRAALPAMIEARWGRVVNIASIWSLSGNREDGAYCASKFGLDGLTAAVAAEVAPHGVLVNAVSPGFIYTEAAQEAYSDEDLEVVSRQIPLGRLGRPEEVAALVSWLVSDENTYLTGQNVLIDGGLTRSAK